MVYNVGVLTLETSKLKGLNFPIIHFGIMSLYQISKRTSDRSCNIELHAF